MEPTPMPPSPHPPIALAGSCACGAVIFQSSTLPISITLCHCTTCRKASGAPFLAFGLFHNAALVWVVGPHAQQRSPIKLTSSDIAVRGSCGNCGSPLFMKYHCRPDGQSVAMGLVDNGYVKAWDAKPTQHIFLKEKALWWDLPDDGLMRHNGAGEAFEKRVEVWKAQGSQRRTDVAAA